MSESKHRIVEASRLARAKAKEQGVPYALSLAERAQLAVNPVTIRNRMNRVYALGAGRLEAVACAAGLEKIAVYLAQAGHGVSLTDSVGASALSRAAAMDCGVHQLTKRTTQVKTQSLSLSDWNNYVSKKEARRKAMAAKKAEKEAQKAKQ